MLSLGAAIFLSMAAAKASPFNEARKDYSNCLIEVHNKAIGDKTAESEILGLMQAACITQRDSYKIQIVKQQRSFGSSASEAEEYAGEELQIVIENLTENYASNLVNKSTLVAEK
jgi:transcriptional regulator CtsR